MYQLVSFFGQDDIDLLPFFLEHYRAIGIRKFHLLVHGSWTQAEFAALKIDDVVIAGIIQSPFDVVMKSTAIETAVRELEGEWLVIVDADEFLELPYGSLDETTEALTRIGLDELPATLLQRVAADGSLPTVGAGASLDALFPCYDYRLSERMSVTYPIWTNKYPLVRLGPKFRLSLGHHLPSSGRPSAHLPIRGVVNHFKWRDRLLRSISRIRGEGSNQREQDAYRVWLEDHEHRLPTTGLRPYSRAALVKEGYLLCPSQSEGSRLVALRILGKSQRPSDYQAAQALRTLQAVPPAIEQRDRRAAAYLDRGGLLGRPGKIALVTSDILGLRRSGGIGTAMAALAERLSAAGHEVHVFLSPYADFPIPHPTWITYWEARGVRIHHFPRQGLKGRILTAQEMSLVLCGALAASDWDAIHFPDAGGLGTAALLQRAAGLAFQSTRIAVTVHGPSRWHRAGNLLPWTGYEAEISELEGISISLADVLVFPSAYMMDWCRRHYPSPAAHVVVPNSLTGESRRFGRISTARRRIEKIVFFGRVELRKGIDTFISAVEAVLANGISDFEVIFLGSLGQRFSESDIWRRIEHWPCRKRLVVNYTTHDAVGLLRTENCLVVIPSRVDNSPYTVYECLENGVPFIASDVGGIPELVRDEDKARVLVSGDADEYAARILDALKHSVSPALPSFDPDQADLDLLSLHGRLVEEARAARGRSSAKVATDASVIVHGSEARETSLGRVLERWAQDGVEILPALAPPRAAAASDSPAAVLNRLAGSASADHLLFCHASVTPRVELLAAMFSALAAARADAIVCGYEAMGQDGEADIVPVFAGPPELSTTRNVYGAKLFFVRKQTFLDAGGFAAEPEMAEILEWEFLNRLRASGSRVLAIPAAMATVTELPPQPALSEYQLGRLTAPWAESVSEPLKGFVRMALHPERKPGQANGPRAASAMKEDDVTPTVPDVRDLDLAALLARRNEINGRPASATLVDTPPRPSGNGQALPASDPTKIEASAGASASSKAFWDADSPLNGIEQGPGRENESGRQGIGPDGHLLRPFHTYLIQSAADADGCDFLVADDVADARQCRAAADAFREIERHILTRDSSAGAFLRFEEMLALSPDEATPLVDAVRRATEATARFYCLTQPIYPARLSIARTGAGAFVMPSRAIAVPRAVMNGTQESFAGSLCLDDDGKGGESYFTALDIAVLPRRGRYIGSTGGAYHERATLRVTSGALLTMSFVMRFSADDMSPSLRRLY